MQGFDIGKPGEGDGVIGPPARNRDRDFVLLAAVKRPLVLRCDSLDNVDRVLTAIKVKLQK